MLSEYDSDRDRIAERIGGKPGRGGGTEMDDREMWARWTKSRVEKKSRGGHDKPRQMTIEHT
jgi:hypothetical protein